MYTTLHKTLFTLCMLLGLNSFGQEWSTIETPVETNQIIYDMVFPAGQDSIGFTGASNVTYNGKGKIMQTTDLGETWEVIWESDVSGTGIMSLYFFSTTTGYAGTMDGDLMKTTDGGSTWTTSDIDADVDQGEIRDINFYDAMNGCLVTGWNGIYTTDDGGATWTVASTNFTQAIDVCYASSSTLFACGFSQNIYKSTDGGDTWNFSYQGPNGPIEQWVNLGVDFLDVDNGAVTSEEGQVFITSDGGDSWTESTIIGQSGLMNDVLMLTEDDIYVTATPGDIFVTANGGTTWESELDPEPTFSPSLYKILFTESGHGFVCGSGSTGGTILKREPLQLSIDEAIAIDIEVYPNPANEWLRIQLDHIENDITLLLLNSMGQIVRQEKMQQSEMQIDTSELTSGSYILIIQTKDGAVAQQRIQIMH